MKSAVQSITEMASGAWTGSYTNQVIEFQRDSCFKSFGDEPTLDAKVTLIQIWT